MLISLLHSQHEDWPLLLGIVRKTRRKHARPPLLLSFACHHGNLCQAALCASRIDAQYTAQPLHRSFAHSLNFSEIIAQRILRQQSRLLRAEGKYIAQKWQPILDLQHIGVGEDQCVKTLGRSRLRHFLYMGGVRAGPRLAKVILHCASPGLGRLQQSAKPSTNPSM